METPPPQLAHPAFPYEWPGNMHPLAWALLHLKINGVRTNLGPDDINGLAKWIFDELGAQMPTVPSARQELVLTIGPGEVGQEWSRIVDGAAGTTARIIRGQLPPGLKLADGQISGIPEQSGSWLLTIRTGPQVHYQAPLDGPIGTYNPGTWVDIDTPIEHPKPAVDIEDLEDDVFDELEQKVMARRRSLDELAAEAAATNPPPTVAGDGQDQKKEG